jgi:hypothetical protein
VLPGSDVGDIPFPPRAVGDPGRHVPMGGRRLLPVLECEIALVLPDPPIPHPLRGKKIESGWWVAFASASRLPT